MNLKKNIFNAITIILLAALIAGAVLLNNRIKKLETQMSYTSDNTSVILSDVQTMQDDIKSTLEEEASLNEIVQLVGKDFLSAADQLTLETAKMLREDFLQQNGFMEVDWYSSYERQDKMIQMILDYDKLCRAAIEKGAATAELFAIPFREQMGRAKSVPDDRYAAVYADMAREMEEQIADIAARGGAEV